MDRIWFITTLKLARDEISALIAELESERDEGAASAIALALTPSVYRSLNYAWNTRNIGDHPIVGSAYEEVVNFPRDIDL